MLDEAYQRNKVNLYGMREQSRANIGESFFFNFLFGKRWDEGKLWILVAPCFVYIEAEGFGSCLIFRDEFALRSVASEWPSREDVVRAIVNYASYKLLKEKGIVEFFCCFYNFLRQLFYNCDVIAEKL